MLEPNQSKASRIYLILLFLLLLAGLGIRLYDLKDPPLDIHPTRQLHSALMARGMYYATVTDAPEWMIKTALLQGKREAVIEPPIIETVTAWFYRISGGENIWFARIFSSFWWVLAGYFLYRLASFLTTPAGGLTATAVYLFLPYAVQASRTFQPDPMLVALIVISWWTFIQWRIKPNWTNAVILGLASGSAIFVKNIAIFWLAIPYLFVLIDRDLRKTIRNPQVWIIALLSVLPAAIYTIYGTYVAGFLKQQFSFRFFPELWIDPSNYARWFQQVQDTAGIGLLILAMAGFWLFFQTKHRRFMFGIIAGYVMYGLTFAYHIATHDYYQLPLIPFLALAIAPLGSLFADQWTSRFQTNAARSALVGLFILSTAALFWLDRGILKQYNYQPEVTFWQQLGDQLRSQPVIGLTQDYGYRMAYYGWNSIENWPGSGDLSIRSLTGKPVDIEKLFSKQIEGRKYFLVTWFDDYKRQPELQQALSKYSVTEGDGYLIFNLLEPAQ